MATARVSAKAAEQIPKELPLFEYLKWAADRNREHRQTPTQRWEFRSPLWEFVRYAKAHPDLEMLRANDAFEVIREIPWLEWFPESEDPSMEFLVTWNKVRVPAGADILHMAASLAQDKPLRPRNCISPKYGLYVSIAGRLQELRPGDYIRLPVVRLGQLLSVESRTVSFYADQAKRDGYLTTIAKHHALSHQAAKYTFDCGRFNMETGEELTAEEEPHFHKERKDSKDSEDLKESHDQRETSKTLKEPERHEGLRGLVIDSERLLGIAGGDFPRRNQNKSFDEKRQQAKQQAIIAEQKFGQKGNVASVRF